MRVETIPFSQCEGISDVVCGSFVVDWARFAWTIIKRRHQGHNVCWDQGKTRIRWYHVRSASLPEMSLIFHRPRRPASDRLARQKEAEVGRKKGRKPIVFADALCEESCVTLVWIAFERSRLFPARGSTGLTYWQSCRLIEILWMDKSTPHQLGRMKPFEDWDKHQFQPV